MKFNLFNSVVAGLILSVSSTANAGLIDNGQIKSTIGTGGTCISCSDVSPNSMYADNFAITEATSLSSISFDIGFVYETATQVTASLATKNFILDFWTGTIGESAVKSFEFTGDQLTSSTLINDHAKSSSWKLDFDLGNFVLNSGIYWVSWAGDKTSHIFEHNVSTVIGVDSIEGNGGHFITTSQGKLTSFSATPVGQHTFRITTNSLDIPEPSTLAIFALAMFGLASRKLIKQ